MYIYSTFLKCLDNLGRGSRCGVSSESRPFCCSRCTFVPGSEKSTERTFAPVKLLLRGTFAPGEREVQELSFHGTFAPLELSLLRSECSKNFRFMENSHPGTFSPQTTFVPFNFRFCETFAGVLKKLWKAGKQCVHRCILANVRCYLWSVFGCSVRSNNDVEGWHRRFNAKAQHGQLNLCLLQCC